jgi:hypothetical protein
MTIGGFIQWSAAVGIVCFFAIVLAAFAKWAWDEFS